MKYIINLEKKLVEEKDIITQFSKLFKIGVVII